jgi:hypothetical protein
MRLPLHIFYDDEKIVVLLDKKADVTDSEKVALLVHESVHVWQEIRKRMGEKEPSSEFEAYSVQSIFWDCLVFIRRVDNDYTRYSSTSIQSLKHARLLYG